MTRTVDYAVNSYQICLGQTNIDLIGSRDGDDFHDGSAFFVELQVDEKPGFRNRFRDHWRQVEKFTLYFVRDNELSNRNRGRVACEWNDSGRIQTKA